MCVYEMFPEKVSPLRLVPLLERVKFFDGLHFLEVAAISTPEEMVLNDW